MRGQRRGDIDAPALEPGAGRAEHRAHLHLGRALAAGFGRHCLGGSAGPEPHDGTLAGVPAQLTGRLRVGPGWLMGERVARGHAHELLILSPFETGSNAATMPV